MRHCHIVLLHAAAAAVLLCMVMSALGSNSNQLSVHEGIGVHFGRDRGLKGHHTPVADVPNGRQVWLYSLVGTDFSGAVAPGLLCLAAREAAGALAVECQILSVSQLALAALRCATAAAERCRRCRNAAAALAAALYQSGLPAGAHDTGGPHEKQRRAPQLCSLACA